MARKGGQGHLLDSKIVAVLQQGQEAYGDHVGYHCQSFDVDSNHEGTAIDVEYGCFIVFKIIALAEIP